MLDLMFIAALLAAPQTQARPQPSPTSQSQVQGDPVDLGDVVVIGGDLEQATRRFVGEVAAPVRGRRPARWHVGVCVAAANLQGEVARTLIDAVSARAVQLGLNAGEPGCHPSILIVATTDAGRFSRDYVAARPSLFRSGLAGTDHGGAALNRFLTEDRPVRWWIVSLPIDADNGKLAVRPPGWVEGAGVGEGSPMAYAPRVAFNSVSSFTAQIIDETDRAIVIVDVDRLGDVSLTQLADYVAMVTLAQIDPEADTAGYATILNLFDDPSAAPGLTDWDQAYLRGLYGADQTRGAAGAGSLSEITGSIMRARRQMEAEAARPRR